MALKIRLRQQGRNNRPSYRLVVTQVTAKRDGKYVEAIGWYDPFIADAAAGITLKQDRLQHWLTMGAQLSESAEALIARSAPTVLKQYKTHVLAQQAKACAKRRARRQKAEG
jgi:small subunit ribosomal protein S16